MVWRNQEVSGLYQLFTIKTYIVRMMFLLLSATYTIRWYRIDFMRIYRQLYRLKTWIKFQLWVQNLDTWKSPLGFQEKVGESVYTHLKKKLKIKTHKVVSKSLVPLYHQYCSNQKELWYKQMNWSFYLDTFIFQGNSWTGTRCPKYLRQM